MVSKKKGIFCGIIFPYLKCKCSFTAIHIFTDWCTLRAALYKPQSDVLASEQQHRSSRGFNAKPKGTTAVVNKWLSNFI